MLRYFFIALFNAIALYVLFAFVAGRGGIVDSAKRLHEINGLERQKIEKQIEVEDYRRRLAALREGEHLGSEMLVMQGRKSPNAVIFRFTGPEIKPGIGHEENPDADRLRILWTAGAAALLIITGNVVLLLRLSRRQEGLNE